MKCADARELLSAYLDDALDADQRSRLADHLRECPTCAAELKELRQTIALLGSLEEIEPPAEFRAELRQRLQRLAADRRPADRSRRVSWLQMVPGLSLRNAVAAALVLVITLAGGVSIGYRLPRGLGKANLLTTRQGAGDSDAVPPIAPDALGKGGGVAPSGNEGTDGGELRMGVAAAGQPMAAPAAKNAASPFAQKIIRNGNMTLAVEAIDPVQQKISDITVANGGYIENSSFQQVTETSARASLQLRVPAVKLDGVVAEVEKLGQVKNKGIMANDVTAVYTDADARLKNLQLQEGRLRDVLVQAATVDEILRVENELSRIRTDIDVTAATLRNLQSGIEMGTLTVDLEQDPEAVAVGRDQSFWNRVQGACVNTVKAIGRFLISLAIFIGGSLPVLIILVVAWLVIRPQRWLRRDQ